MTSKKTPIKKEIKNHKNLYIEILQNGIVQISRKFTTNYFFSKKITLGSNKNCDFYIPFSLLSAKNLLFNIYKNKVYIILAPRSTGFISTGHKFGDIHEFLRPRGSLAELATVDDPLVVELFNGARGELHILGYDIIFKYEQPIKKYTKKIILRKNVYWLSLPNSNEKLEKYAILIAIAIFSLVAIPMFIWLLKSPYDKIMQLSDLDDKFLAKIINPLHYKLLPEIFKEEYSEKNAYKLTLILVEALQKRWTKSEQKILIKDKKIKLLQNHYIAPNLSELTNKYNNYFDDYYTIKINNIHSAFNDYYNRVNIKQFSANINISGDTFGSNNLKIERRIYNIKKTYYIIKSNLLYEHEFIHKYYNKQMKFTQFLDVPSTGFVLGTHAHPDFIAEKDNFITAEYLYNTNKNNFELNKNLKEKINTNTIYLNENTLLLVNKPNYTNVPDSSFTLYDYATAKQKLPTLTKPKAYIAYHEVENILKQKYRELQNCYEILLHKSQILELKIKINWQINMLGIAENILINTNNVKDNDFNFCIKSRISNIKFPHPKNGSIYMEKNYEFKDIKKRDNL